MVTSNISVSVTADATTLRSQLALAQADIKTYGAAVRAAAQEIKSSDTATAEQVQALERVSASYNAARAAAANLRTEFTASKAASGAAAAGLDDVAKSAVNAAHGSAGVSRELLVMTHETMMGNFTRLGGSMMVLAERTNALHAVMQIMTPTVLGLTGVVAGLAGGFAYLVVQSIHAETALRGVYNAALLQGRSAAEAESNTKKFADEMSNSGVVGNKAAMTISAAIQSVPGVADDVRAKLSAIAPAMFEVWGRDADETAKNIDAAFKSIGGMSSFLTENHLLTSSQTEAFKAAETATDTYQAQRIAVDALTARLGPAYAAFKNLKQIQADHNRDASMSGLDPVGADAVSGGPSMPVLRMPQTGSQAESEETTRQSAAVERYNQTLRERQALEADEVLIQQRIASASSDSDKQMAEAALKVNQAKLQMLKDPGDSTWAAKIATQAKEAGDAAVLAAHDSGAKREQINEAGLKAEMSVYQSASRDMTRTDAERNEARRQAITLEMSLVKTSAGAEVAAAREALEARLATLSAQQAAEHGNFAAVMALEQQKLALLKANGGTATKAYQNELKVQEDLTRQHVQEIQRMTLDSIVKQEANDRDALATKRADLDVEVSDHMLTKSAELRQLQSFAQQQYQIEHQALADFLANNNLEVADRQKALDQMSSLESKHAKEVAALNAQMAAANRQVALASEREWMTAFTSIGSSGERAVTGLLEGTETYRKAELQVAQSLISSAVQTGAKLLESWAATELAKTEITGTGEATRRAVEAVQEGGATGLSTLLAHWIGLETAKTAATTAGAATRATADSSGGFISEIGSMLAQWVGLETAKTGGTVAGATARTTAETTAATASLAVIGASARAEIAAAAAVSAAFAFADSAMLGPPGLAAAPGVSAAAYATTMAFQATVPAFAVGATNLPADMIAQVHQGEMIVPAFESSMIRSGAATLGAGGATAGGGGAVGGDIHFNISAIDAASVHSFFQANGSKIAAIVSAQQTRNPSMRPKY